MLVWLSRQGFESSVNKVFQKEKLINSKTNNGKDLQSSKRKLVSAGANLSLGSRRSTLLC
jgi:hypothetical protein